MLGEYLIYSGDKDFIKQLYNSFIVPMADFLASYIDDQTGLPHASYDLWEEKFLTSTYTTSVVYAGLVTAYEIAEGLNKVNDGAQRWLRTASKLILNSKAFINPDDGVLRKGFLHDQDKLNFDETLDTSSFFGPMVFGYPNFDLSYIKSTVQKIEDQLAISEHSITPRYMYDAYFRTNDSSKGNPWIVCSLWLAQYYLRTNQIKQAETILNSVAKLTLHSGVMPEQVHPESLEPISVTPLVWSHAEYVNTVLDLITKNKK